MGKNQKFVMSPLIIWAFFAFIIHLFGTSLNGSFPGAYYMAGQGAQLAFVILTFGFASGKTKSMKNLASAKMINGEINVKIR